MGYNKKSGSGAVVIGASADITKFTGKNAVNSECVVTFIDDDAPSQIWTFLKDIFISEGAVCNIALTTASPLTDIQLLELKSLGWNIVNHTRNHVNLSETNEVTLLDEIIAYGNELTARGFDGDILVNPYGAANDTAINIARKSCVCEISKRQSDRVSVFYLVPPVK
jgi:peptidoglycan/xylan/chitin deacetylase (PgdA/CDA1 family)